jgi:hypothetical protein
MLVTDPNSMPTHLGHAEPEVVLVRTEALEECDLAEAEQSPQLGSSGQ